MLGTIVNASCILAGSILGTVLRRGISERYTTALFNAMGLVSIALGCRIFIENSSKSEVPVLFIVSMAAGGLAGSWLDLQGRVERYGHRKGKSRLVEGLTASCLLYCIGTFSIVGPVLSALKGDNTFLYTNATLDLVTSAVLATTYGIGMVLAAPVLFCWQGAFYLAAKLAGGVIPDAMVTEISIVGGTLIAASGLGILQIKDCKTLNLLPSLAVPILFFLLKSLF